MIRITALTLIISVSIYTQLKWNRKKRSLLSRKKSYLVSLYIYIYIYINYVIFNNVIHDIILLILIICSQIISVVNID